MVDTEGWSFLKLYFKENARERMIEQNVIIRDLLKTERNMWKNFIKIGKQIYLPEKI